MGVDFNIVDDNIEWISGKEPTFEQDPDTDDTRGQIITYSYFAKPIFIVQHLMHELRVTQEFDEATGEKVARRLPQQVLVKKDFLVRPQEKRDGS